MKIVYFGSSSFAVAPLAALQAAGHEIVAVVTQPDKPANRGRVLATPVKAKARELSLPVLTPERVNTAEVEAALAALQADLFVAVAYGQFLSAKLLALPRHGVVNIHPSLLPRWRGAAPIQRAILAGDTETGVTTMFLDAGMDSGPTILAVRTRIQENETAGELSARLAEMGATLLLETIRLIESGEAPAVEQQGTPTFAPLLTQVDEKIDWNRSASQLHNQIRALAPETGCYCFFNGKRVKLWRSWRTVPGEYAVGVPGEIVGIGKHSLFVACGSGVLEISEVQPEGKGRMEAAAFSRGYCARESSFFTME